MVPGPHGRAVRAGRVRPRLEVLVGRTLDGGMARHARLDDDASVHVAAPRATRNLRAADARGHYLVFLTQDALPLDDAFLSELVAPMEADEDPDVRAVILTGSGRFFCAGLDLRRGLGSTGGAIRRIGARRSAQARSLVRSEIRSLRISINACATPRCVPWVFMQSPANSPE